MRHYLLSVGKLKCPVHSISPAWTLTSPLQAHNRVPSHVTSTVQLNPSKDKGPKLRWRRVSIALLDKDTTCDSSSSYAVLETILTEHP